jgi:crossover junction endodeoxyribonuclease RuvC
MPRFASSSWRSFDPTQVGKIAAAVPVPYPCRVLGLDPGSRSTGFGIIDCTARTEKHVASGCIKTSSGEFAPRLREIYDAVEALVQKYQPQEVAIERVFMHRNPDSALKLGQARGAALCAALINGAAVYEYAPRAIKLAIVGTGAADKGQVAHMIQALLGVHEPMSADASDALAVGLCHGHARRAGHLLVSATQAVVAR